MAMLPRLDSVLDLRFGRDPHLDAWMLHFLTENHLEYAMDPEKNASPEQLRFMVVLDEDQIFAPCSDRMTFLLLRRGLSDELRREYGVRWLALVRLVQETVEDRDLRRRILGLARFKLRLVLDNPVIIPSRLLKRFITIMLTQSGLTDLYAERKRRANRRAQDLIDSELFDALVRACPHDIVSACVSVVELRYELDMLELRRLLYLSTLFRDWEREPCLPEREAMIAELAKPCDDFERIREALSPSARTLKILYIPDVAGELMFDLLIVQALLRQGHRVVLALKEGFHFRSPSFWDWEGDPVLADALGGAHFLDNPAVTKNVLLDTVRRHAFVVISDGTRELLNLHRTSVTFARAWKESDLILAKGPSNHRRLCMTDHQFTRDVLCFFRDEAGNFRLVHKPKPDHVHKFSEADLIAKADAIVADMRRARAEGHSVMFYSGIIGSIPGHTSTAIAVMNAFVADLRERLDAAYIINPAEHFEEGMDADDLMFMWERVQRSGLIDIWRFQTTSDIERGFELLGRRIPAFWAGKDATYSTGCTKEMHIALAEQRKYPEMQIIGPVPERFFRRSEYGVGKFCDAGIECT
jgi:uncharacterized protein with ATP-grasp and redox domains